MGKIPIFENALLQLGFVPVMGTTEACVDGLHAVEPLPSYANMYGRNNGITVVYDHRGCPSIRCEDLSPRERYLLNLKLEDRNDVIHVPHSNDGGLWTSENLPDRREGMDPSIP